MKVAMLLNPITIVNPQKCGGVERIALSEFECLRRKGIEAKLYVRKYIGVHPYIEENNDFLYGKEPSRKYYVWFVEKSRNAEILHGLNTPLLGIVSKSPRVLIHMHNLVKLPYYEVAYIKYKQCFFAFCSSFLREDFLRKHPDFPRERCFILYNGVDTNYFAPKSYDRRGSLSRILYAGSWNKPKGIFVFLRAIKLLEKRRRDFEALIAGSPYLYDTGRVHKWQIDAERMVRNAISDLKCTKIIENLEYRDVPRTYQSSDIFVFPSTWEEPFGLCIIEAMASGIPVIASRTGGIPEIIEEGKTGLLVKPSEPKELADTIEYLLDNEDKRRKIAIEGRRRVERMFSLERHIRNLLDIYEKMRNLE